MRAESVWAVTAWAVLVAGDTVEGGRTCTTCKAPVHSWNTLPVSFHSARTDTGPDGLWTDEDIQTIKKFPLVTVRLLRNC